MSIHIVFSILVDALAEAVRDADLARGYRLVEILDLLITEEN